MRFLYPAAYGDIRTAEAMYTEEIGHLAHQGFPILTFSMEEFEAGTFKKYGDFDNDHEVVYRGWMLTPEQYIKLYGFVQNYGSRLITLPFEYVMCHYLPRNLHLIKDLTAPTFSVMNPDPDILLGEDLDEPLEMLGWPHKYFVKDFVKSLSTEHSSVATSGSEVLEIGRLIKKYRGHLDGGLCIRQFEDYKPNTERRYFVFQGKAHSDDGAIPEIVQLCAERIKSPFFSVDVAERADGVLRVVEIGDGQVSDLKTWDPEHFAAIFRA